MNKMNRIFVGKIISANSDKKTITIECDDSISGIKIDAGVILMPDNFTEEDIVKWLDDDIQKILQRAVEKL